jgi:hypothetical protein
MVVLQKKQQDLSFTASNITISHSLISHSLGICTIAVSQLLALVLDYTNNPSAKFAPHPHIQSLLISYASNEMLIFTICHPIFDHTMTTAANGFQYVCHHQEVLMDYEKITNQWLIIKACDPSDHPNVILFLEMWKWHNINLESHFILISPL